MIHIDNAENKLVVQANTLIEASYKLKPSQQKFLRVMASMINFGDEDFKMYEFKISELLDLYGIKDQSKYSEIPKQTKELMGNVLTFKDEKSEILVPFLSFYKHEKGEGTIKVQFHPFLKPFYLYLNKENPFTKYRLKNIVSLKSTYSIRFYELLKQYEGIKSRILSIDEIRRLFKIDSTEYTRYNDFKRFVLLKAQKELKDKTDINFDFEEIKTGRKVTSIRFFINSNKNKFLNNISAVYEVAATISSEKDIKDSSEDEIKSIILMMKEHNISALEARKIYNSACGDLKHIAKIYNHFKNKNADNFVALMIKMVKPGEFIEPKKNTTKTKFNNFNGRDYDYDELEKKLLGWD
ncbi:replication initiation protein [uncultured Clostridium sp.]|uniref:replication initiation protein n=1 Tax=uncultured Clostridium sp. TaxID=59620 RepID=UPI0025E94B28|nr:replication initiation protein [uncultured Clostridium sp.]